jgi:hypothetical protein
MPRITEEQREASRLYKEGAPASVCACGHTGDGAGSQHSSSGVFSTGHGACTVPGCSCERFRWERFRIPYINAVGVK